MRDPLDVIVPIGSRRSPDFDADEIARANGDEPPRDQDPEIPDDPKPGPEVEYSRGACVVRWDGATRVTFEFDRFISDHGDLKAEVIVRSTVPGLERQVHHGRENLLSTRTRADLVKALQGSDHGEGREWKDIVPAAFTAAVGAFRQGEPAVLLRDVALPATAGNLLPFVLDGAVTTVIHGDGGGGKSTLALAAIAAIHTGRADIIGFAPAATRRCALFDWEGDGSEPRGRLEQLVGHEMPDLLYVPCAAAIWDDLDRLNRIVRDRGIELAVVDSVGLACGGLPPESSEAALRFNSAFRSLRIGGLLIAHKTKAEGGDDYPFGSVFWRNSARATWFLKKQDPEVASSFKIGLYQKKANTGPGGASFAFEISFADGRLAVRRCDDIRDEPDLAKGVPIRWRLQKALASGPRLITDLAEELEAKPDSVATTLRRYAGRLFVRSSGPDGVDRWANLAREQSA